MEFARPGRFTAALAIAFFAVATAPAGAQAFPQMVRNCDYDLTVPAAPSRIVAIKSTSIDLLLALGLGKHIIGQAFQDGPPPAGLAEEAAAIPVMSDKLPSRETVLSAEPDFVFAGWESNVSGEGIGPRALLASFGVGSYVSPSACRSAQQPGKLTFDLLFEQFAEAGRIFGATDAATRLIADQKKALASIVPSTQSRKVAWYSSGSDVPYMGAGSGMPQAIMTALGLTNIAADIDDGWSSMSWEAVAEAEPDLFVIADANWSRAERKIGILQANPVLAKLEAVKHKRFIVIPFAASEAGISSIAGAMDLARQLSALSFDD